MFEDQLDMILTYLRRNVPIHVILVQELQKEQPCSNHSFMPFMFKEESCIFLTLAQQPAPVLSLNVLKSSDAQSGLFVLSAVAVDFVPG